jgi:Sulfatase
MMAVVETNTPGRYAGGDLNDQENDRREAQEIKDEVNKSGVTRRRLVKIINGIGAGMAAAVIARKEMTAALAEPVSSESGSGLPFPPVPTASTAGPTLQESKHVRRAEPDHLPPDAPNILIVLLDDVGFGLADTLGGEVHTPTLTRLANEGVAFNQFHTTSICSPTRAALLAGRNHQRVGSGTIAERALDLTATPA